MVLPNAVLAAKLEVSKFDLVVYPVGKALVPSSIPNQSVLPPLSLKKSFPVIKLFTLVPNWILKKFLEGTSFVLTWIKPPAHSPGSSGTNALLMIILSIIWEGNKSKEKVLRSGSVLVNNIPFNIAWLYLSAKPLTIIYLPSWIEAPGVLFKISAVFLSGLLLIVSAEITEATVLVFFWKEIKALSVEPLLEDLLAETVTSANFELASSNKTSTSTSSPALVALMSWTVLFLYPT